MLDKGFWGLVMARALIVSYGWFVSMFPSKLKIGMEFSQGDGIEVIGGLMFGGSWGPEPPTWFFEK